ncbi:hypothetical protein BRD12_06470 [Halobacteriales archaeon SW_12_67_38]|nr:MAG: hypothetical protein BRC80_10130 [Halobacteriales archaeon QH_9_66_26]PSQ48312.1 MAG: hypothetical protein BRD12_06470 [Halobacteriales archaeon SW_12_67_38]
MDRRALLAVVAGLVGGAGCLGRSTQSSAGAVGTHITDRDLTLVDSNSMDLAAGPAVAIEGDASQIIVTGTIAVGSEKCKTAKLESAAYDADTDTLSVEVTHAKSGRHPDNSLFGGGCDDAMSIESYRAVISFADGLPETVDATEHNLPGGVPSEHETQYTTAERT